MTDKVKQVKAFANDTLDKKNYLNKQDIKNLMKLFDAIKLDLSDSSFPTRTNRLEAVENMKRVLEIHNYKITTKALDEHRTKFADALDHHEIMQKGIVR